MPKVRESSPYRLYNEDCFETFKRISDGSVDMVLCDLPYGTTACKWDAVIPFEPLWREYRRICKPNAAIVLTASQPFTTVLIASNLREFRYCWVWEKEQGTGFGNANKMPLKSHEDIPVFYRQLPNYFPQGLIPMVRYREHSRKDIGRHLGEGKGLCGNQFKQEFTNFPKSVVRFPRDADSTHPTQKPFALMQYLVKTYTAEGDTVLDNCMGSGTTGVACAHTGRRFIGCDSDTEHGYFEIAETRIKVAYAQAAAKPQKS